MRAEAHARRHPIVVPHPETAKMNSVGVVPVGKRKRVVGLEPSVVGMSALRRWVKQCFQCCNFNLSGKKPGTRPGKIKKLKAQLFALKKRTIALRIQINKESCESQKTSQTD
jgi:hypothetical protein